MVSVVDQSIAPKEAEAGYQESNSSAQSRRLSERIAHRTIRQAPRAAGMTQLSRTSQRYDPLERAGPVIRRLEHTRSAPLTTRILSTGYGGPFLLCHRNE